MIEGAFDIFVTIVACIVYIACGLVMFVQMVNAAIHVYHRVTGAAYVERYKGEKAIERQVEDEERMVAYHQKLIVQNIMNMMVLFMICVVTFVISYNIVHS